MKNISDIIESYLKEALRMNNLEHLDVRRSEIAEQFQCVPSQVNYVINTRFTLDKGFLIESKRGGGGYIRIVKVKAHDRFDLIAQVEALIGNRITQSRAESLIVRLYEEQVISRNEMRLMASAVNANVLAFSDLTIRDELRARILLAMIQTIRYSLE